MPVLLSMVLVASASASQKKTANLDNLFTEPPALNEFLSTGSMDAFGRLVQQDAAEAGYVISAVLSSSSPVINYKSDFSDAQLIIQDKAPFLQLLQGNAFTEKQRTQIYMDAFKSAMRKPDTPISLVNDLYAKAGGAKSTKESLRALCLSVVSNAVKGRASFKDLGSVQTVLSEANIHLVAPQMARYSEFLEGNPSLKGKSCEFGKKDGPKVNFSLDMIQQAGKPYVVKTVEARPAPPPVAAPIAPKAPPKYAIPWGTYCRADQVKARIQESVKQLDYVSANSPGFFVVNDFDKDGRPKCITQGSVRKVAEGEYQFTLGTSMSAPGMTISFNKAGLSGLDKKVSELYDKLKVTVVEAPPAKDSEDGADMAIASPFGGAAFGSLGRAR